MESTFAEVYVSILGDELNGGLVHEFRAVAKDGIENLAVNSVEDDAIAVADGTVNLVEVVRPALAEPEMTQVIRIIFGAGFSIDDHATQGAARQSLFELIAAANDFVGEMRSVLIHGDGLDEAQFALAGKTGTGNLIANFDE